MAAGSDRERSGHFPGALAILVGIRAPRVAVWRVVTGSGRLSGSSAVLQGTVVVWGHDKIAEKLREYFSSGLARLRRARPRWCSKHFMRVPGDAHMESGLHGGSSSTPMEGLQHARDQGGSMLCV